MFVSVVVCTYQNDAYENVIEAVTSLLDQSHPDLEIIIVVDGNESLRKRLSDNYKAWSNVHVVGPKESTGTSRAKNLGIEMAKGDVVAFLDDDAVASKEWIKRLINTYQKNNPIAVGGKVLPIWLNEKPDFLPEELYWLVGLTYEGFSKEGINEIRNALGPNMSFKREVFEEVGSFNPDFGFGKKGMSYIQAEEPELALRMKNKLGKGVFYDPELVVYHKVTEGKTKLKVMLRRAFYQGYSKGWLKRVSPSPKPLALEESYLRDLLFKCIPRRVKKLFLGNGSIVKIKQLLILFATIMVVGLGFIWGHVRSKTWTSLTC